MYYWLVVLIACAVRFEFNIAFSLLVIRTSLIEVIVREKDISFHLEVLCIVGEEW